MPIKLRGFTRRKSSANASTFEDVNDGTGQGTFRVFERPPGGANSGNSQFIGGRNLMKAATTPVSDRVSDDTDTDNIFAEPGHYISENRSSTKLSSSSTLPSFSDPPLREVPLHNNNNSNDIPVPQIPESTFSLTQSIRSAGRTFSLGSKAPKWTAPKENQHASVRERTLTASTSSTTTPPKLPSTVDVGGNDYFGNMFDKIGSRTHDEESKSTGSSPGSGERESDARLPASRRDQNKSKSFFSAFRRDRPKEDESHTPPYLFNSQQNSGDNLMPMGTSPNDVGSSETGQKHQKVNSSDREGTPSPTVRPSISRGSSPAWEDEDAKIVMTNRRAWTEQKGLRDETEDEDSETNSLFPDPLPPSPAAKPKPAGTPKSILRKPKDAPDAVITDSATLAARYEEKASHERPMNKVVTHSQYRILREQEELRDQNIASNSDESEDEEPESEDEDEIERKRAAASQRKKQEAHMSLYRQKMMKVTGETGKLPFSHPNQGDTQELSGADTAKVDEEDEEIPLAILAAHGFPGKNRPPSRLTPSVSNPNLRASLAQSTGRPASVSGDQPTLAVRGSLPPFARNLPSDPYFGAGLVNKTNRESLAMGGGTPPGISPQIGTTPPGLAGNSLINVIVNEEKARMSRRGSPNGPASPFTGGNGNPNGLLGTLGNQSSMALPVERNAQTPPAAPTNDMTTQMTQLMQLQIQWMQTAMQMQGLQTSGTPGLPPMPGMSSLSAPPQLLPNPVQRPMSMASQLNFAPGGPQVDQRTLSILDPTMSSKLNAHRATGTLPPPGRPGYAASVAPSERSNVGTASRYRPVSTAQNEPPTYPRASTFTSTLHPFTADPPPLPATRPSSSNARPSSGLKISVGADSQTLHPPQPNSQEEDDDDEQGWAQLKQSRESRKSQWKFKKTSSTNLGDIFATTS